MPSDKDAPTNLVFMHKETPKTLSLLLYFVYSLTLTRAHGIIYIQVKTLVKKGKSYEIQSNAGRKCKDAYQGT